ncbi:hypothetical protein Pcinc_016771 [Petrolisthes cinctipes]|uniref:BEACH domain-containing protein n=1 Tax=Petrolisthes cinctipes TaxID=88211 RepID=A0AAE1FQN2_PETCI|nr:hypothetical protein Pcinc_016771 [Petrolisthes cinctipes]
MDYERGCKNLHSNKNTTEMRGESGGLAVVCQNLGIPPDYSCQGPLPGLVHAFIYTPWINGVLREGVYTWPPQHDILSPPEVQSALQMGEKIGDLWQCVLIQIIPKEDSEVYPLARPSRHSRGLLADVSYSQLLHYVSTSNNKNLWKDAYKKYSEHGVAMQWKGGMQVGTEGHNTVLREVLHRLYGCKIIPIREECDVWQGGNQGRVGGYGPHTSVLPALCAIEDECHLFLILSAATHNVHHAVSFSPAKLNECETRPLFVVYQLLEAARDTHDRGLHMGDITLRHLFIDDALYLSLLPSIPDSLIRPEFSRPCRREKVHEFSRKDGVSDTLMLTLDSSMCQGESGNHAEVNVTSCQQAEASVDALNAPSPGGKKGGSSSDCSPLLSDTISDESANFYQNCHSFKGLVGYQKLLSSDEAFDILKKADGSNGQDADLEFVLQCSLVHLTQLWVGHQLTTLDYLLCLNYFAGRRFNSPHHHPIVPWVMNFSSRESGWRDLSKTKFRLTKGDQQLDQTYQMAASQGQGKHSVAHHVTEVFSEITYYVYKARVTPRELLTKYVRQQWVPEHYPSTIARLYAWTPDECIPEFYTDPTIFKSQHEDLGDLGVPEWCVSVEEFLAVHRGALEGHRVSSRLHHWLDLNFGHKLSGGASVKAKNVCLQLVDAHTWLATGGVVQLFATPHPPRLTPSPYLGRSPPKFTVSFQHDTKTEKCEEQSEVDSAPERQEDEMETINKSLEHSRKLSRSRTSLCEERLIELPMIQIPQDYNPLVALNQVEMLYNFVLKASRRIPKVIKCKDTQLAVKQAAHLRRVRDMQAIGCVIVELFSPSRCRVLGARASLAERYLHACKLLAHDQTDIPRCIRHALQVIFQATNPREEQCGKDIPSKYEPVSTDGLPPPSPHQFLQSLINVVVFPSYFPKLYQFVCKMRQYSYLLHEAQRLCGEPTRRKEFILRVAEIRVKTAAKDLPNLLPSLSSEGLDLLLPYLTELFEYPESAVTAAWYLTSALAQALGPERANKHLLPPVMKLFEAEVMTDKHLKLFHRSFLLQLVVWLGLHTFLTHFITPLIEGVGGYKEVLGRAHLIPDIVRKQSTTLKSVDISLGGDNVMSPCEDDSHSSAPPEPKPLKQEAAGSAHVEADLTDAEAEPEVFVFEGGEDEVDGSSPDTPLQEQDQSDHLRSPMASETLSLDEVSLQEGIGGSIPSLCPSPHSPSMSGGEGEEEGIGSGPDTPTPLGSVYSTASSSSVTIPKSGLKSASGFSASLPDFRLAKDKIITNIDIGDNCDKPLTGTEVGDGKGWTLDEGRQKVELGHSMSDVCCESVLWLAGRLGPVLTARYITRNLLRMLTLCYLPDSGALTPIPSLPADDLSVTRKRILGDIYSKKVLHCLSEIACLYGEQVILLQYLCHICELVASCRRKLSTTMEGGLLGAMALLQHLLPYLTDSTFMEHLQETLIRSAVYPVIRLLSSTKVNFPHGGAARGVLACRVIDCLFIMALRVGREMSKSILMPTVTRLLTTFDKCHTTSTSSTQLGMSPKSLEAEEVLGEAEEVAGSSNNLQAAVGSSADSVKAKALEELKQVMTPELAYLSYVPLCRFLGASYMEAALPNHDLLRSLCLQYDENNQAHHAAVLTNDGLGISNGSGEVSGSSIGGSGGRRSSDHRSPNVAMTGNRIDIKDTTDSFSSQRSDLPPSIGFSSSIDITKYTGNKMENTQRHLRGNWLAYWEHEIGRSEQDARFNFKQIKLQTFVGHTNSVKSIHVLDNENSFISCSKDKTVKLWSLRNQGDGSAHICAQWTYTGHKKSVFGVTFSDAMRYAASCDSTVHVWDPFICAGIKQLDSLRHSPVTVLTAMMAPSTQLVAATTDATLKFIDLRTCSYTHEFKVSLGGAGLVRCVDTSGDGRLVTVAHSSGVISALDTRTGHLLSTWKPHEGEVLCMKWYRDGTFISSALDQTVSVWSVEDSKLKFTLRGPTEPVHLMSLYGDELLTGTTANRVGVHTSVSPTASFSSTRLRSDTFRGVLTTMAVLPLNRILLLGADNGTIRLLC